MNKLPDEVKNDLRLYRQDQEQLILQYTSEKNNEMVYLVRWSILEKLVKSVASQYRKDILRTSLREWLEYLNNSAPKPSKTPNTNIEQISLPKKSEFITSLEYFGLSGQEIWSIMDSKGKHRRYRNELAHTGRRYVNYLLYLSLSVDLEKMVRKVFGEIESN